VGSLCQCEPGFFDHDCGTEGTLLGSAVQTVPANVARSVTLTTGEGVSIPAGALGTATDISIKKYDSKPQPSSAQSTITPIGPVTVFGPPGTQFSSAVTVLLSFTAADLPAGQDAAAYWLNEATGLWESLGGSINGGIMEAQVDHFTKFAVMAVPRATTTAPPTPTTAVVPPPGTTLTDGIGNGDGEPSVQTTAPPTTPLPREVPIPAPKESSSRVDGRMIAGIVVACVVALATAIGVLVWKMQLTKKAREEANGQDMLRTHTAPISPGSQAGYVQSKLVFAQTPKAENVNRAPSFLLSSPDPPQPLSSPRTSLPYGPELGAGVVFGKERQRHRGSIIMETRPVATMIMPGMGPGQGHNDPMLYQGSSQPSYPQHFSPQEYGSVLQPRMSAQPMFDPSMGQRMSAQPFFNPAPGLPLHNPNPVSPRGGSLAPMPPPQASIAPMPQPQGSQPPTWMPLMQPGASLPPMQPYPLAFTGSAPPPQMTAFPMGSPRHNRSEPHGFGM